LAVIITVLFMVVAGQSLWVQWFHAAALNASPLNPRNNVTNVQYPRGEILAANGAVLEESQPTDNSSGPSALRSRACVRRPLRSTATRLSRAARVMARVRSGLGSATSGT
jgi:hypothetical protein